MSMTLPLGIPFKGCLTPHALRLKSNTNTTLWATMIFMQNHWLPTESLVENIYQFEWFMKENIWIYTLTWPGTQFNTYFWNLNPYFLAFSLYICWHNSLSDLWRVILTVNRIKRCHTTYHISKPYLKIISRL